MNGQVVGINQAAQGLMPGLDRELLPAAVLNITSGSLDAITITPTVLSLSVAGSLGKWPLHVFNNSSFDISMMNIWASSSPAVSTISASGHATAVATVLRPLPPRQAL